MGCEVNRTDDLASVGALIMIVPLYQAELAHPSIRGRITSLQQLMLGAGNLIAAWISYGTYISFSDTDSAQWRIGLGLQILPALFLTSLILLFPESPRWLIHNGRSEEGLRVLAKLHAAGNEQDGFVQEEYDSIVAAVEYEKEHAAKSYVELFKTRSSFRRLITAMALQASVQMSGVSAIQYYSPDIYGQIGKVCFSPELCFILTSTQASPAPTPSCSKASTQS